MRASAYQLRRQGHQRRGGKTDTARLLIGAARNHKQGLYSVLFTRCRHRWVKIAAVQPGLRAPFRWSQIPVV